MHKFLIMLCSVSYTEVFQLSVWEMFKLTGVKAKQDFFSYEYV